MPETITEAIFNSKNNLARDFPTFQGVKYFDLERKHFLYGRIDKKGNAIYLNTPDGSSSGQNLEQIYTGKGRTEFAVDFVVQAFTEMRRYVQKMAHGNHIRRESPYNKFLRVHKAWRYGDLENSYYKYLNKLYVDFVNNYITREQRASKIKDFGDFIYSFLSYIGEIAYYFPLTKTGYILSHHCSPFISGLMIEIASEVHGIGGNESIFKYANDPNFITGFWPKTAKKFGFLVDKNAPWRLVFNVGSGARLPAAAGAKKYMNQQGVGFDNVLDFYYDKAHLGEVDNLRNYLHALYTTFQSQFEYLVKPKYTLSTPADCWRTKISPQYEERIPPPNLMDKFAATTYAVSQLDTAKINRLSDEYWIKIVFKLRLLETGTEVGKSKFNNTVVDLIRMYRLFGLKYALNQINDLTKGLARTKFIKEGKYWYGDPRDIHETRKAEAMENMYDPEFADRQITGALNKG